MSALGLMVCGPADQSRYSLPVDSLRFAASRPVVVHMLMRRGRGMVEEETHPKKVEWEGWKSCELNELAADTVVAATSGPAVVGSELV
jgi:hypothetical protein